MYVAPDNEDMYVPPEEEEELYVPPDPEDEEMYVVADNDEEGEIYEDCNWPEAILNSFTMKYFLIVIMLTYCFNTGWCL